MRRLAKSRAVLTTLSNWPVLAPCELILELSSVDQPLRSRSASFGPAFYPDSEMRCRASSDKVTAPPRRSVVIWMECMVDLALFSSSASKLPSLVGCGPPFTPARRRSSRTLAASAFRRSAGESSRSDTARCRQPAISVGNIHQHRSPDRRLFPALGAIHFPERTYRLRFLIIEQCEILLLSPVTGSPAASVTSTSILILSALPVRRRPLRELRMASILLRGRHRILLRKGSAGKQSIRAAAQRKTCSGPSERQYHSLAPQVSSPASCFNLEPRRNFFLRNLPF